MQRPPQPARMSRAAGTLEANRETLAIVETRGTRKAVSRDCRGQHPGGQRRASLSGEALYSCRGSAPAPGRGLGVPRQRLARRGRPRLALQSSQTGSGSLRRRLSPPARLTCPIILRRALTRALGRLPLPRRLQLHTGPSRLGQTDRDRLFRGSRAVFAFTDVLDLFMDELACLCRRRLAFTFCLASAFDGSFLWHRTS